jgi:RNA polymerase sigma factor (sigma-70 family)
VSSRAQHDNALRDDLVAAIPNMRAFAISLCGNRDRADDLVQEALVKAWNHLDSFEQGTNLKAWLFTILRNAYFSELRKTKREIADSEGQLAAKLSVPPEQQGHLDLLDLNRAAAGPARGADPGRRRRLFLRGRSQHLRLCRRHREEPREPRPHPPQRVDDDDARAVRRRRVRRRG